MTTGTKKGPTRKAAKRSPKKPPCILDFIGATDLGMPLGISGEVVLGIAASILRGVAGPGAMITLPRGVTQVGSTHLLLPEGNSSIGELIRCFQGSLEPLERRLR